MTHLGVPRPSSPGGPLPWLVCAPLLAGLLSKCSGWHPQQGQGASSEPQPGLSALILLTAMHDLLLMARGCWEGGSFNIRVPCSGRNSGLYTGVCLGLVPHHLVLQLAFSLHPMTGIWSQATSLGQLTSCHSGLCRAVLAFPPRSPPTGQLHTPPPTGILTVGVTAQGASRTAPSTGALLQSEGRLSWESQHLCILEQITLLSYNFFFFPGYVWL